jgi:hypothetical protein
MGTHIVFKTGDLVGARRWPNSSNHPECWRAPYVGVVLSRSDPAVWANTIAFAGTPSQTDVDKHIESCEAQGLLRDTVPVGWDFEGEVKIHWEPKSGLKTPEKDRIDWEIARLVAGWSKTPFAKAVPALVSKQSNKAMHA